VAGECGGVLVGHAGLKDFRSLQVHSASIMCLPRTPPILRFSADQPTHAAPFGAEHDV